jgi:hypothetical protein
MIIINMYYNIPFVNKNSELFTLTNFVFWTELTFLMFKLICISSKVINKLLQACTMFETVYNIPKAMSCCIFITDLHHFKFPGVRGNRFFIYRGSTTNSRASTNNSRCPDYYNFSMYSCTSNCIYKGRLKQLLPIVFQHIFLSKNNS